MAGRGPRDAVEGWGGEPPKAERACRSGSGHWAACCGCLRAGGGGGEGAGGQILGAARGGGGGATTGLRERGNDTSRSTGRSGRQNAATRRNMRREERVTVQGPVKEQQPDGMSHRGAECWWRRALLGGGSGPAVGSPGLGGGTGRRRRQPGGRASLPLWGAGRMHCVTHQQMGRRQWHR